MFGDEEHIMNDFSMIKNNRKRTNSTSNVGRKMKKILYIAFLIFTLASCKAKENVKDFINKGFSKPQMASDASYTVHNVGDGGTIYVPSEQAIEASVNIKNKYSVELKGEIEMEESKRHLFSQEPFIKDLNCDKMLVAFTFKVDAEPASVNSFFGESVPLTLKIFEKKTGRFLSKQTFIANCNTPPKSISRQDISYDAETDEYVILLPKNEGKHQDLKKVVFTLSSEYGSETVESRIVSIVESSEQGKVLRLKIKGSENWQLKAPSGVRALTATVYDIAGLHSLNKNGEGNKNITSITLIPESQNVSMVKAVEGVPAPRIKELEEYFDGTDWKKAGYSISHNMTGFSYEKDRHVFKKETSTLAGEHKITVNLLQNGNIVASAVHTINVLATNVALVDKSKLTVQDITQYETGLPSLQFDTSTWVWTGDDVEKTTAEVPYTGKETKLKVHVEGLPKCSGEDAGGSNWGAVSKDYEITLPVDSDSEVKLSFTIVSEDGSVKKKYEITFKRAKSVTVEVQFAENQLPDRQLLSGSKAKAKASWTYGEAEWNFEKGGSVHTVQLSVAKDATVNFDLSVGSLVEIVAQHTFRVRKGWKL